jgi:glucan endo-1,3-alpha-glucosidase
MLARVLAKLITFVWNRMRFGRFGALPRKKSRSAIPGPMVFGYNMLSQGLYGSGGTQTSVANLKLDIQDAKAIGLDGFIVAVGAWTAEGQYKIGLANMFQAASESGGFKLAISVEFAAAMTKQDAADVKEIIDLYKDHANMFKVGDKPVFMDSGRVEGSWFAANVANTHEVAYFPYVYAERSPGGQEYSTAPTYAEREAAHDAKGWSEYPVNEGLFNFVFGGVPSALAASQEDYFDLAVAKGKMFIDGVSPYYTSQKYVNDQIYTWESLGGEGIEAQFLPIIRSIKPLAVVLSTWNDLGETYWSPCDPAKMGLNTGRYLQMPALHPHIGFAKLAKYFVSWIKAGVQPAVTKDEVFYFYRTHPKDLKPPAFSIASMTWSNGTVTVTTKAPHAFATGDSGVPITHAGQVPAQYSGLRECNITGPTSYTFPLVSDPSACTAPGTGILTQDVHAFSLVDSIFVTTLLTAPATLRVISGGVTTDTAVGSGMVHTRVPFNTGAQIVRLIRGDTTLIDLTGEDIKPTITLYDFNPTTGYGVN